EPVVADDAQGEERERAAHREWGGQDLEDGDLGDEGLMPEPALVYGGEIAPIGVPTPADPLFDERPERVREHRKGPGVVLMDRLVTTPEDEPGEPPIVACDAAPP